MHTKILFFIIGLLSIPALADSPDKDTSLSLTTHLYTEYVDGQPNLSSRLAGTIIEAGFTHHLAPDLDANIIGGMRLEGGSSRALYNDEFAPRQTPLLREAMISWKPISECQLRGGTLNQNFLNSPLIVSDQSFPGAHESCTLDLDPVSVRADLEQTYASDTQFTHPTGRSLQSDAEFFIERVTLEYKPVPDWKVGVHVSHYLFSGLSSLVAYQSQFMGNTSSGINDKNADFRYAYQPYEVGAALDGKLRRVSVSLYTEAIKNPGAPGGQNTAYQLGGRSKFDIKNNFGLVPGLRYFRIESDATPAWFNDASTAHANSQGVGAEMTFLFPKTKAEAALYYDVSHPIAKSIYQPGTQSWVFAVLRLHYDVL